VVFVLKTQEIPYDSPESDKMFDPLAKERVLVTDAVRVLLGDEVGDAGALLADLYRMAQEYRGLDYLQVFMNSDGEDIWIIEEDAAITVMTPSNC
jgi:hypothetical protein